MVAIDNEFDAVEESAKGIDPVPTGEYEMIAESAKLEPNKKGTGTLLKIVHQIVDGEFKGRKVFEQLNWSNPNATAEQISKVKFAKLCLAVGVKNPRDTDEILNLPFKARVIQFENEYNGKTTLRNEVDVYFPKEVEATAKETGKGKTKPAAKPKGSGNGKPSWGAESAAE